MIWHPIKTAPMDGREVRVRIEQRRELPWLLYFHDDRWRYCTTGAPVHPWHEPEGWSPVPRLVKEREFFDAEIYRARGARLLPSQVRAA